MEARVSLFQSFLIAVRPLGDCIYLMSATRALERATYRIGSGKESGY